MCCIFTCFGWILDLINRSITFTMSCTIVAAACCAFLIAGMAGIALGYNYSLHEYMDLRETGVQPHDRAITKIRQNPDAPRVRGRKVKQETRVDIKLRRGIFDDDLQQDLEFSRRSGRLPPPSIKDGELARPIAEEKDGLEPPQARRRLEDMVGEEPASYESSLKRLTGGPIASNSPPTIISDDLSQRTEQQIQPEEELSPKTDQRSIDRLKAIQSLINSKKQNAIARRLGADKIQNVYDTTPELDPRFFPPEYLKEMPPSVRKAISQGQDPPISPQRKAVPDYIDMNAWRRAAHAKSDIDPKLRDRYVDPYAGNVEDYSISAMTHPPPVRLLLGPERPTRPAGPPSRSAAGEPHNPYARQWPPGTPPAEPSGPLNENQLLAKFNSRKQVIGEPQTNIKSHPADYYEDSGGSRGVPRGY